jgi:hypothetical protein
MQDFDIAQRHLAASSANGSRFGRRQSRQRCQQNSSTAIRAVSFTFNPGVGPRKTLFAENRAMTHVNARG